jgi:hypothetical protein
MDHAEAVPELAGPAGPPGLVATFAAAFNDDAMTRWPMPAATMPPGLSQLIKELRIRRAAAGR